MTFIGIHRIVLKFERMTPNHSLSKIDSQELLS